jgi:hypothetical protein
MVVWKELNLTAMVLDRTAPTYYWLPIIVRHHQACLINSQADATDPTEASVPSALTEN